MWGGGKEEGNVPSVRASTQPDTTVGTVRLYTLYTKVFSRSKSRFCPFYILYTILVAIYAVFLQVNQRRNTTLICELKCSIFFIQ